MLLRKPDTQGCVSRRLTNVRVGAGAMALFAHLGVVAAKVSLEPPEATRVVSANNHPVASGKAQRTSMATNQIPATTA